MTGHPAPGERYLNHHGLSIAVTTLEGSFPYTALAVGFRFRDGEFSGQKVGGIVPFEPGGETTRDVAAFLRHLADQLDQPSRCHCDPRYPFVTATCPTHS